MGVVSRGFGRTRAEPANGRLPPGQYDVGAGFPVLSAGPTPYTSLDRWDLGVHDETGELRRWSWDEYRALPREAVSASTSTASPRGRSSTPTGKASRSTRSSRE